MTVVVRQNNLQANALAILGEKQRLLTLRFTFQEESNGQLLPGARTDGWMKKPWYRHTLRY